MAPRIRLIYILALLCVPVLSAKDMAAYNVGDAAETDIIAPVALDVIDPVATAALKSSQAMRTPAIFRICSDTTNALADEFLAGFADAQSNFTASVQDTFHQTTVDDATIASPDFGYLITAFNIKNKKFPVTSGLAAAWARGNPDLTEQKRLLNFLLLTMQHPIRPDDLPENFIAGETLRLAPVSHPNEKLTLADAITRGTLITGSSLVTVSQLRAIFRREFTSDDEQPLARALTALLRPNCFPDADLTQLARDHAVRQLVVADHYDAGQLIVRQGAVIDAKTKMALNQLDEKLPVFSGRQTAAGQNNVLPETPPALAASSLPPSDAPEKVNRAVVVQNQTLKNFARDNWPAGALAGLLIVVLAVLWRWVSRRRAHASLLPASVANLPSQNSLALHAELAPHLAQVLKEVLVQELAVQRRELLVAQQVATAEIIGLVQRLDELKMTMQERAQAYEMQIQKLETELAARTEENHELLKLKIEMIRQQLEIERSRNRMDFN